LSIACCVGRQGDTWHTLRAALTPDMCNTKVVQFLIPGAEAIANDYINCVLKQRDANSSQLATVINLNRYLGVECEYAEKNTSIKAQIVHQCFILHLLLRESSSTLLLAQYILN
jgi:hypothetical protein